MDFIELMAALPKAELHLHLRGAIPMETLAQLLMKYYGMPVEGALRARYDALLQNPKIAKIAAKEYVTAEDLRALFQYDSLLEFLDVYTFTGFFIRDVSDFWGVVDDVLDTLVQQNIVYAEINASLLREMEMGIPAEELYDCLREAKKRKDIRVNWILGNAWHNDPAAELAALQAMPDGVGTAITLGGKELFHPPEAFAPLYNLAREKGLHTTVHVGEAPGEDLGARAIWRVLEHLKPERIGHGVRAIEDEALLETLKERQIPLEVCPTSNVVTGLYPSIARHPLLKLADAGAAVTVNTDDPTFFQSTLAREYAHLQGLGAPAEQIKEIMLNAYRYAFIEDEAKAAYIQAFDAVWDESGPRPAHILQNT